MSRAGTDRLRIHYITRVQNNKREGYGVLSNFGAPNLDRNDRQHHTYINTIYSEAMAIEVRLFFLNLKQISTIPVRMFYTRKYRKRKYVIL